MKGKKTKVNDKNGKEEKSKEKEWNREKKHKTRMFFILVL